MKWFMATNDDMLPGLPISTNRDRPEVSITDRVSILASDDFINHNPGLSRVIDGKLVTDKGQLWIQPDTGTGPQDVAVLLIKFELFGDMGNQLVSINGYENSRKICFHFTQFIDCMSAPGLGVKFTYTEWLLCVLGIGDELQFHRQNWRLLPKAPISGRFKRIRSAFQKNEYECVIETSDRFRFDGTNLTRAVGEETRTTNLTPNPKRLYY